MDNDFLQAASNAVASGVSFPVDALTWALRKAGLPIDKPIGGSDWMTEKGLTKPVDTNTASNILGETFGNLLQPLAPALKGAAASKAMLLAATLRDPKVKTAVNLANEGRDTEEIWQAVQRAMVPMSAPFKGSLPPENKKWMKEIIDNPAKFKPGILDATGLLKPGFHYNIEDVIDHPELFKEAPFLKGTKLSISNLHPHIGAYEHGVDTISLNPKLALEEGDDLMAIILHELQHKVQRKEKWPLGSGTDSRTFTPEVQTKIILANQAAKADPNADPYIASALKNIAPHAGNPMALYNAGLGEQQAFSTQSRFGIPAYLLRNTSPVEVGYPDVAGGYSGAQLKAVLKLLKDKQ